MSKSSKLNLYDSTNFTQLFEIKNELDKVTIISSGETEINASAIKFVKKDSNGNVVGSVVDVVSFINNLELKLNNMTLKIDSVFPNAVAPPPPPPVIPDLITPTNLTGNSVDLNFIVSRSSIKDNNLDNEAYRMFDSQAFHPVWLCGNNQYDWIGGHANGGDNFQGIAGAWFKVSLNETKKWNQYTIQPTFREELLSSWSIYGSNDDINYTLITSQTDYTFPNFTNQNLLTQEFNLNFDAQYRYIVFHVTKIINEGSLRMYFGIREFRFNKI